MGLGMSLMLDTRNPPLMIAEQLVEAIRDIWGSQDQREALDLIEQWVQTPSHLSLGVWDVPDEYRPDANGEPFGIDSTIDIRFRLSLKADTNVQDDDIALLTARVLERVAGDALLYTDYSRELRLIRKDGVLILSDDEAGWPPRRLAAIKGPYRRAFLQQV